MSNAARVVEENMPINDFRCGTCGAERLDVFQTIAEQDSAPQTCCGQPMLFFWRQAPMGVVQAEARYKCPVTRKVVTTRHQRSEIMREHNLADANDTASPARVFESRRKFREEMNALAADFHVPKELKNLSLSEVMQQPPSG